MLFPFFRPFVCVSLRVCVHVCVSVSRSKVEIPKLLHVFAHIAHSPNTNKLSWPFNQFPFTRPCHRRKYCGQGHCALRVKRLSVKGQFKKKVDWKIFIAKIVIRAKRLSH